MPRGFTAAIDGFKTRKGPAWLDAVEITNDLQGLGAARIELNTLLGIAAAESAFDFDAVGALNEWGAWQIETEDTPPHAQAQNALAAMRMATEEYSRSNKPPLDQIIDPDMKELMRIVRASWQRGGKKKNAIKRWLKDVKSRYQQILNLIKRQGTSTPQAMMQAVAQMTSGGTNKVGVDDFIAWSATKENSNRTALEKGQKAFNSFMEATDWSPSTYTEGKAGKERDADETKTDIIAAGDAALKAPGVWLKDAVKWGFENIREGGKELLYQTTRTVLPPAMLVLGGYALYKALSSAWSKGKKS